MSWREGIPENGSVSHSRTHGYNHAHLCGSQLLKIFQYQEGEETRALRFEKSRNREIKGSRNSLKIFNQEFLPRSAH